MGDGTLQLVDGGSVTDGDGAPGDGKGATDGVGPLTDLGPPEPLTVEPVYSGAADWLDYIKRSDPTKPHWAQAGTACDPLTDKAVGSCVHAGVMRKAVTTLTSCSGLQIEDTLGALQWTCDDSGGKAVLYATGLREDRGLAHLLDATGFKDNRVLVRRSGNIVAASAAAVWWQNPVKPLPPSTGTTAVAIKGAGTIYTVASDTDSAGHNIEDDQVAVVVLNGATLSMVAGPSNCSLNTAERASPNHRCLLAAGNQRFLWIEGALHNKGGGHFAVHVMYNRHLQLRRIRADSFIQFAISLQTATTCRLHDVVTSHNGKYGIVVATAATQNMLSRITVTGNGAGDSNPGNNGIFVTNATDNVFTRLTLAHNTPYGMLITSGTQRNTVGYATVVGNSYAGISITGSGNNTLFSTASLRTGTSAGIKLSSDGNQLARLALGHQPRGLELAAASNATVSHDLLLAANGTDCRVGGAAAACSTLGSPTVETLAGFGKALEGKVTADDTVNAADSAGAAQLSNISDWTAFENEQRSWGPDADSFTSSGAVGPCTAACRIWDWRLGSSADKLLVRVGGSPSTATVQAGAPCPPAVDGDLALTDNSGNTFLVNALERLGDGLGDEDGLCESDEGCVYAPHIGRDQLGSQPGTARCTFSDGTVSGVRMYGLVN